MSNPIKITEAQARWLRSVKAGDVTLRFAWGGSSPIYQDGGYKAQDRGVLKRLREARLIQDEGTVTGSRRDHPITLTDAGRKALEARGA